MADDVFRLALDYLVESLHRTETRVQPLERRRANSLMGLADAASASVASPFFDPACSSSDLLVTVLRGKLGVVRERFDENRLEQCHRTLSALMSLYGVGHSGDVVAQCRRQLLRAASEHLSPADDDEWFEAAGAVVHANITQGDALDMVVATGDHGIVARWRYLGDGTFERRDFQLRVLVQQSMIDLTLFSRLEKSEIFSPFRTYPNMKVAQIAQSFRHQPSSA